MTGFGSAERGGFRVEVRSLNHRFLEIVLRMPPVLGRYEITLRQALQKRFERGKFDVYVSASGAGELKLKPNLDAAKEIRGALEGLKEGLKVKGEVDLGMLLHWKETFITEEVSYNDDDLLKAFGEAVSGLEAMRTREGEALGAELLERAEAMGRLNDEVMALAPVAIEAGKERFLARLKELFPDGGCDDARLVQEAASQAERADIAEETARLKNHVEHMKDILSKGGAVGRRLDFLFQELNREANTIASKADDYRISALVIDMKAEIERAREQAQNVQ